MGEGKDGKSDYDVRILRGGGNGDIIVNTRYLKESHTLAVVQ